MKRIDDKLNRRNRRKKHIRKSIKGSADKPRMTVYRSNKKMYIQVIDDDKGATLVSASNIEKDLRNLKNCVTDAGKLGEVIGERLLAKKIEKIVFDRNGYFYHGIVKAIADGARKQGIQF